MGRSLLRKFASDPGVLYGLALQARTRTPSPQERGPAGLLMIFRQGRWPCKPAKHGSPWAAERKTTKIKNEECPAACEALTLMAKKLTVFVCFSAAAVEAKGSPLLGKGAPAGSHSRENERMEGSSAKQKGFSKILAN